MKACDRYEAVLLLQDGMEFRSLAHFTTSSQGDLDVSRDVSKGGSYTGYFYANCIIVFQVSIRN